MNEQTIYNKLISSGLTKSGATGLMGNLYAESALNPKNLQNAYEKTLGYTDESYTKAVDSGKYTNFIHDSAGYGLAQWTFYSRKQDLYNYAKQKGKSIGDLEMQIDFLIKELKSDYSTVWKTLCTATDVKTASDCVMCNFERPADTSTAAKAKRAGYGEKYFKQFANANTAEKKSVSEIAKEVIANTWGTGSERKSRLESAGYDYSAVQAEVNRLLNADSNSGDSIEARIYIDGKTYSGELKKE